MKTFEISVNTNLSYTHYQSEAIPYQDKDFLIVKTTDNEIIMIPVTSIISVKISENEKGK